jgi:hypothetical protein
MGALAAFVLPRYVGPRRYLELLHVEEPLGGTTEGGDCCWEEHFIVRYEGNQVQPLPIAQWEPKKRVDRAAWKKCDGTKKQGSAGALALCGEGNWRVETLNPSARRSGLWLYPGETLRLTVSIVFPIQLVVGDWKHREIPGAMRFQYGLGKSLNLPHTYSPLMPVSNSQASPDRRAIGDIAIRLFCRGLRGLQERLRTLLRRTQQKTQ